MAEALQFVLVDQVMGRAAQRVDDAVVLALEDALGELDLRDLLAHAQVDLGALIEPPGRRQHGALFEALLIVGLLHHLVNQVA